MACSPCAWPACILGRRCFFFYCVRPNRFVHPGSRRKGPKGKRSTLVLEGDERTHIIALPHGPGRRKKQKQKPKKAPEPRKLALTVASVNDVRPQLFFFFSYLRALANCCCQFSFLAFFSFPYLFLFVGTVSRCAVACSEALSSSIAEQKQTGYNRRLVILSSAIAPVCFIFPSFFACLRPALTSVQMPRTRGSEGPG